MSTGRLDGSVAMITGGASGMGRATVERFLAEGASVVIADINADNGEAKVGELAPAHGDRVRFVRTDVAEEADVAAVVAEALDTFGRLDIVFNNAGIGGAFGPITEVEVSEWDYTFAVLCRSVFLGIKHGARAMLGGGHGGSIISTASVAGLSGGSGPHAYSAAKAAVINLTRAAAIELAPHGIRVNAVCPGVILTPLAGPVDSPTVVERLDGAQPWPSHGTGADIAGAALFLASEDARFVTGEAIVVDGGLTAAGPNIVKHLGIGASRRGGVIAGVSHGTTGRKASVRQLGQ
jgi:NAD(P)-dependent dehydrogenase (short-subunit alcohol dehydrogenase family)